MISQKVNIWWHSKTCLIQQCTHTQLIDVCISMHSHWSLGGIGAVFSQCWLLFMLVRQLQSNIYIDRRLDMWYEYGSSQYRIMINRLWSYPAVEQCFELHIFVPWNGKGILGWVLSFSPYYFISWAQLGKSLIFNCETLHMYQSKADLVPFHVW